MSRSLPTPPLSSLPFSDLQGMASYNEPMESRSPKEWFDRAKHEADLAVLAERSGKKEEMFLAYTRSCQAYSYCKMHPSNKDLRKTDPHWTERVKDFKETYEIFLGKAKEMKEQLKKRDVEQNGSLTTPRPGPSRSPSGPDIRGGGSIADRMKALGGHGMDIGNPNSNSNHNHNPPVKRYGKDLSAPPIAAKPSQLSSIHTPSTSSQVHNNATGSSAGGNLGSLRATNTRQRSGSGSSSHNIPSPSSATSVKPPSIREEKQSQTVRPSATGSSTRSRRSTNPIDGDRPLPTAPIVTNSPSPVNQNPLPIIPSISPPNRSYIKPSIQPSTATPSRHPLPFIPQSHTSRSLAAQGQVNEADTSSGTLKDFEKAFPSLSEFGKQFQDDDDDLSRANARIAQWSSSISSGKQQPDKSGLPNGSSKVTHQRDLAIDEDDSSEMKLPDIPNFPVLPSAPSNRPGLPLPPRRADSIDAMAKDSSSPNDEKALSPPVPEPGAGLKRPASVPNVATLPGDVDLLSDEPILEGDKDKHPSKPSAPIPQSRFGPPNGVVKDSAPNGVTRDTAPTAGLKDLRSPPLSFPVAVPTPPPSTQNRNRDSAPPATTANGLHHSQNFQKPKFPFSNSVTPDELRSYFLNPAVEMLLLDVRSEEEFQRGYVGREYEPRGAKVNIAWMDPTVLMREGMTAQKLEDSLSLSPTAHQKAFQNRNKFDLVVVYDSKSTNWPNKEKGSTPTSKLWDMIYEYEFQKKLDRTPVLLLGGYEAWREFIKMRAAKHAAAHANSQGHGHGHSHSVQVNGQGRPFNPKANGYSANSPRLDHVISPSSSVDLTSKRANREMPVYQSAHYAKNITDSFGYAPQSMTGEPSSYISGQPSRSYAPTSASHTRSPSNYSSSTTTIAPPPQASIHPGPGARRRSDYLDQHGQTYSGSAYAPTPSPRPAVDYPQAHALATVPQPPPAAISPMDRYDTRPAVVRSGSIRGLDLVAREGDEVRYWNDVVLGLTGLKNLGNTCYMNSTLQCLSATFPFTSFFLDGSYKRSINVYNPLGTKGNLANAFAELLKALWKEDYTFLSPVTFRKNIITFAQQFSGTDQHDSQEFLSFVLDGLHEDLNRVKHKPPPVEMTPEREAALETLPPEVASEKEWQIYRMRNDSFIVDLFQGQYRNRLECLTCHKTSTTYDTFMYMSLPVPAGKSKVVVQELIDEFVKAEIMEKEDAWNCPRCKVPRTASKTLTISRLPPVLLIQLKRFTTQNGVFWDKSETPVIFPVKSLDLTRYVPRRQSTGREDLDDPRCQVGPFKYDLYGVSNHMGTLSSGHYTAYVKSSKGWMYCEDSKVTKAQEKDVVSRPAYILFYKRIRA
ncbi:uncharacterized protein IL334_007546 [Kwoniella shivajii]|uniref:ubiquitinyl hydrolase 1 n=1 Tax=Kwoniella shivajii TaxID=564305 RepID=A0ABZ1D9G4_9TREE|nr:hypothetical protein IL334_007546 [Kwoniella shivajii]